MGGGRAPPEVESAVRKTTADGAGLELAAAEPPTGAKGVRFCSMPPLDKAVARCTLLGRRIVADKVIPFDDRESTCFVVKDNGAV